MKKFGILGMVGIFLSLKVFADSCTGIAWKDEGKSACGHWSDNGFWIENTSKSNNEHINHNNNESSYGSSYGSIPTYGNHTARIYGTVISWRDMTWRERSSIDNICSQTIYCYKNDEGLLYVPAKDTIQATFPQRLKQATRSHGTKGVLIVGYKY